MGLLLAESKQIRVQHYGLAEETKNARENPREDPFAAGSGHGRRGLCDLKVFLGLNHNISD